MAAKQALAKFSSDGIAKFEFPENYPVKLLQDIYEPNPYLSLISKASYQVINDPNGIKITYVRKRRPKKVACDAACPTGRINDTITAELGECFKYVEKFNCLDQQILNTYGETIENWLQDATNEASEDTINAFLKALVTKTKVTNTFNAAPGFIQGGAAATNKYADAKEAAIALKNDIVKMEKNANVYKKRYSRKNMTILVSSEIYNLISEYLTVSAACCDLPNMIDKDLEILWRTKLIEVPELSQVAGTEIGLTVPFNWIIIMDGTMLVYQTNPCLINNPVGCEPATYRGFQFNYGAVILKPEQVLYNEKDTTTT